MNHIFISYRRDDAGSATGRINDRLRSEYGDDALFLDVDNIPAGVDFRVHLDEKVSQCEILFAVIGKKWLSAKNKRRLNEPNDFVRIEIESALKRRIPVVPLLVEGAKMPSPEALPESIREFAFRQKIEIRPDPDFHNDMDRLIADVSGQSTKPNDTEQTITKKTTKSKPKDVTENSHATNTLETFKTTNYYDSKEYKKWQERYAADEKLRKKAQAAAPAFFARWEFWASSLLTIVLGITALVAGEYLAIYITELLMFVLAEYWQPIPDGKLSDPSVAAGVSLICVWGLVRIILAAAAYWYDPREGRTVFFTRGTFGGYSLYFDGLETVGIWAAWPIATIVAWSLARVGAWIALVFLGWSYDLIFWLALGLYTVPIAAFYLLIGLDDWL